MRRVVSRTLLVLTFLVFSLPITGISQIGDPGGDPDVPISGIEWLLVAGGILGAKKIYGKYKKG